jgi:sirohydrochlorin cobaltochelatase
MHAVILVSHGSVRPDAGREVDAHAERLSQRGIAPIVTVGYLNYTAPDFSSAVAACVAQGATNITVAPYFLVPGRFVEVSVRDAVAAASVQFSGTAFRIAEPIGYDARLADALLESAHAAITSQNNRDDLYGNSIPTDFYSRHVESAKADFVPLQPPVSTGGTVSAHRAVGANNHSPLTALVILAHGSPHPGANDPLLRIVTEVRERGIYSIVEVGFLECNAPSIAEAIAQCIATGTRRVVGVPYFLHSGTHVIEDLPDLFRQAREQYPGVEFLLAEALGRSPVLTDILEARIAACQAR